MSDPAAKLLGLYTDRPVPERTRKLRVSCGYGLPDKDLHAHISGRAISRRVDDSPPGVSFFLSFIFRPPPTGSPDRDSSLIRVGSILPRRLETSRVVPLFINTNSGHLSRIARGSSSRVPLSVNNRLVELLRGRLSRLRERSITIDYRAMRVCSGTTHAISTGCPENFRQYLLFASYIIVPRVNYQDYSITQYMPEDSAIFNARETRARKSRDELIHITSRRAVGTDRVNDVVAV